MNIGINGFGRIGRIIFRLLSERDDLKVKVINDINKDIKNVCYTIKYDTIHGRFDKKISNDKNNIFLKKNKIKYFSKSKVNQVNWRKFGIDILIDPSGILENVKILANDKRLSEYKIITHATYNQPKIKTFIFGVNDTNFNLNKNKIISSSICDTVAFSPLYKIINDNLNILNGNLITLHPWLQYQNLLDGKSATWSIPGDTFSQYALGRSSVQNLIPKSTSAINAAELVIPKIKGKIKSISFRVPTSIVSGAVFNINVEKNTSLNQINKIWEQLNQVICVVKLIYPLNL